MSKRSLVNDRRNYESQKKKGEALSKQLAGKADSTRLKEHNVEAMLAEREDVLKKYNELYEESLKYEPLNVTPIGMDVIFTASMTQLKEITEEMLNSYGAEAFSSKGSTVSDVQTVLAVGPSCHQVKVGDKVKLRLSDFFRIKNPNSVKAEEVSEIPLDDVEGQTCIIAHERNIKYIYNK